MRAKQYAAVSFSLHAFVRESKLWEGPEQEKLDLSTSSGGYVMKCTNVDTKQGNSCYHAASLRCKFILRFTELLANEYIPCLLVDLHFMNFRMPRHVSYLGQDSCQNASVPRYTVNSRGIRTKSDLFVDERLFRSFYWSRGLGLHL